MCLPEQKNASVDTHKCVIEALDEKRNNANGQEAEHRESECVCVCVCLCLCEADARNRNLVDAIRMAAFDLC